MVYRFVGSVAGLGDGRELSRFGEKIELTEDEAHALIASRLALIPDAEFSDIGFTDKELQEFGFPDTPLPKTTEAEVFHGKRKQAWTVAHDLRESLSKGA